MPLTHHCRACHGIVEGNPDRCPHCQAGLLAPACPECGEPVAPPPKPGDHFSQPTWNAHWDGACAACGRTFRAAVTLTTGHARFPSGAWASELAAGKDATDPLATFREQSTLEVRGGESVHARYDSWDHQPTVVLDVRRREAGNGGDPDECLPTHARIVLTVSEYLELVRLLQGPLRPLLHQRPWRHDTT